MCVVLLSTGRPIPNLGRCGPSLVVCLPQDRLLFDCGFGATHQLLRAGIEPRSVTHLFLTHHPYDHIVDSGSFVLSTWRTGRAHPLRVFGPPGTARLTAALFDGVYGEDRRWRQTIVKPGTLPDITLDVREVDAGAVVRGDGWRVTALRVEHPPVPVVLAYAVEAGGRRVVLSADTVYFPPLAAFARGADLLVHEAASPHAGTTAHKAHTRPEEVGRIARAARVGRVALTHLERGRGRPARWPACGGSPGGGWRPATT
jgi:ribonuclease Z